MPPTTYEFDTRPTWQTRKAQRGRRVALTTISKRAAKADKRAVKALVRDGTQPTAHNERGLLGAGLRKHAWQWVG